MIAGPTPCLIVATWPSGSVVGAPFGPITTSGSCRRSSRVAARLGREPHLHVARLAASGPPSRPRRCPANAGRSDCATCPTVTPSVPATPRLSSTSSSGFWPFVDRPMSTAPGVLLHDLRSTCSAAVVERREVVAAQLELDLLLAAAEVAGEHRQRHARHAASSRRGARARTPRRSLSRSSFGIEAHVDVAHVHRARARRRRAWCTCTRTSGCARAMRAASCALSRVYAEVRARRRLDRDDELGAVVLGEEADADRAHRRDDPLGQHDEQRDARRAPTTTSARAAAACVVSANTSTAMPSERAEQAGDAAAGERERGEEGPERERDHRGRWSSAHAITSR